MIIVKQNKKGIVIFDNVTDIYVDKEEDGNRYFVFYIPVSNLEGIDILGEYATEERAEEVLEEIIEKYENIQLLKYSRESLATRDNFIYRMSKE